MYAKWHISVISIAYYKNFLASVSQPERVYSPECVEEFLNSG
jgi:hypothetical protein